MISEEEIRIEALRLAFQWIICGEGGEFPTVVDLTQYLIEFIKTGEAK